METTLYLLMTFVLLNTTLKGSFWRWWQTTLYALVCAVFVCAACSWAVLQSKTELAAAFANRNVLQDIAVLISIESLVGIAFCRSALNRQKVGHLSFVARLLHFYPGLLLFPALFYGLVQWIFASPGSDFTTLSWVLAAAVLVLIPLLSQLLRRFFADVEFRLEVHFLLNLLIAVVGLVLTTNGSVVYRQVSINHSIVTIIMEYISKTLFWISNSLLIPDIIILLVLFVRALWLAGSFYNQLIVKRRNDALFGQRVRNLSAATVGELKALLPEKDNSLLVKYMRELLSLPNVGRAQVDYLLSGMENEADKDLSLSRLLAKMGPVLGLVGTLIAMSPALVGLSTGDISGMAYNMQVVFATTVVGLVISSVGLITLQFKQRWYAKEVAILDYVSSVIMEQS